MKKIKTENYTNAKNLFCDWPDKKNYVFIHGMLKFYVSYGMVVEKVHEILSFKHSKWSEKNLSFNTQKRNKDKNEFEKNFFKLLNKAFCGKTMENMQNRLRLESIKKDVFKKIINNNLNWPSMEFINHMKIVIVIYLGKMKF